MNKYQSFPWDFCILKAFPCFCTLKLLGIKLGKMIWKNNISFFKMVSFLVFVLVSLFIYDWKAHIVFPLLKNLHPALPFLCSSTVSLSFVIYFLFFSVYRSSTTLLLPLLTNFRLLHSVLYEEQFFICDLFSFLKDIFALDFRLENYGRKDFLVAGAMVAIT